MTNHRDFRVGDTVTCHSTIGTHLRRDRTYVVAEVDDRFATTLIRLRGLPDDVFASYRFKVIAHAPKPRRPIGRPRKHPRRAGLPVASSEGPAELDLDSAARELGFQ